MEIMRHGLAAHADSSDAQAEPSVSEPAATAPEAIEPTKQRAMPKPLRTKKPAADAPQKVYNFTSCYDVWAGGQGPFKRGEPGYTEQLDPDGDGIACPSKPKD